MKGKIAYMTEPMKIEVREREIPEKIDSGEVLLEIIQTNICGSDLHNFRGNNPGRSFPEGLGHEMVGRIVKLGENIKTDNAGNPIKKGDRVVPVFFATCNRCKQCLQGHFHTCEQKFKYRGNVDEYPYFQGATFATHYYIHADQYFFKVPDEVSNAEVASANCALSQVIFGIDHLDINFGDFIFIQGAGGLGLNACAVAKEKGAKVIVIDGVDSRLDMAKKFGADYVINLNEFDTLEKRVEQINYLTNGLGANFGIEVTGRPEAFSEGINFIRTKGKYIIMGNIGAEKTEVSPGLLVRKSIQVLGFSGYNPRYLYEAIKFLKRNAKHYPFTQLLDASFSLEEIQTAIEKSINREVTRATILVNK